MIFQECENFAHHSKAVHLSQINLRDRKMIDKMGNQKTTHKFCR